MKQRRIIARLTASVVVLLAMAVPLASAATTPAKTTDAKQAAATGGGSVQGYGADSSLQHGTVVRLADEKARMVAPASAKDLKQMYGVVVDPNQLSLTISDASIKNQTFVATSGTYNVLVSTQDGAIKSGDYITLSAIDGVAMKAGDYQDQPLVFGRAAGSFDGKSTSIGSTTLKDTTGKQTGTVKLGLIPVAINIQRNPNEKSTKANLPKPLQRIGQAIADKPVGPLRIYLSIAITGISILAAIVILYSGVRNSLIAIGRNPLSKKSVFRGLVEIILTSLLILIIGLFAVYLLLKL